MTGTERDEQGAGAARDEPADARATGPGSPGRADPRRRPTLVALSALLVIALVGAAVLWRTRGRAGTSERVRLEWTCDNRIFWPTPDPVGGAGGGDDVWYAGPDPVARGPIQTGQGPGADLARRWADGVLRFDTDDSATFVSDAGGTMVMRREPPGPRFSTLACRLGAVG